MDDRPTPLTDRIYDYWMNHGQPRSPAFKELRDHARQLERSNAELAEALRAIENNVAGIVKDKRTAAEEAILIRSRAALRNAGVDKEEGE